VTVLGRLRLFEKALLPLVLMATQAHGARIWAEAATPNGALLPFTLPAALAAASSGS
jgi:signal transduction histidine kinase